MPADGVKWVTDSFIQLIHSKTFIHLGMKQVLIYEGVIESFIQSFYSKMLIHSGIKQVTVFMN